MSRTQEQIAEVEVSIEQARSIVNRADAVKRLMRNPDFKAIVTEGYLRDEAARLAMMISEPALRPEDMACVARDINGPGAFVRYVNTILMQGAQMERSIADDMQTLDELRGEGDEDGEEAAE